MRHSARWLHTKVPIMIASSLSQSRIEAPSRTATVGDKVIDAPHVALCNRDAQPVTVFSLPMSIT